MTDVGARCPDCAPSRPLPQLEVSPKIALRGIAASGVAGLVLGAIWSVIVPPGVTGIGFFGLILAFGLGYVIATAVYESTNHKSGPILQGIAVLGVAVAYLTRNLVAGEGLIAGDDTVGYIFAVIAAVIAFVRLRY